MADFSKIKWEIEEVPNNDEIYMRVHRQFFRDGELRPNAFRDHEGSISTNWQKYSTPQATLCQGKNPPDNGILSMNVGRIRNCHILSVIHAPDIPMRNRAHTNVFGQKNTEVRLHLRRISNVLIMPEAQ